MTEGRQELCPDAFHTLLYSCYMYDVNACFKVEAILFLLSRMEHI